MRIVYLIHKFYPSRGYGAGHFMYKLAHTAQEAGHTVQVITRQPRLQWGERIRRRFGLGLQARKYYYDRIPVWAFFPPRQPIQPEFALVDTRQVDRAVQLLRRIQPDVVHAGQLMGVGEFWLAAEQLGIKRILTLTDYWLICPKINLVTSSGTPCGGPHMGAACRRYCAELPGEQVDCRLKEGLNILQSATRIFAPSTYLQKIFQAESPAAIRVIEHGVQSGLRPRKKRSGFDGGNLTFLYSGALVEHKGVHVLIQAFQKVKLSHVRLVIFGSGTAENALRALAQTDSRICFCGYYTHDKTNEILQQADAVIIPSIWAENCPQVVLEAMACAIPVFASNIGGLPDLIQDGITGFLFPPGDPKALADLIDKVATNPSLLSDCYTNLLHRPARFVEEEFAEYMIEYQARISHNADA
jgi:glycosyltransferase involved in cell wall biosynthesis